MANAVFTHKVGSIYDDLPEERYHFPGAYRRQVEAALGDLIIYYERGRTGLDERDRSGRRAYVATARVVDVRPDTARPDHFYAVLDPTTYVPFDRAVPFREGEHYFEQQLRRDDGKTSKGAFGRAVRRLSDREYDAILRAGFAHELGLGAVGPSMSEGEGVSRLELAEGAGTFEREFIERVMSRPVRDAAFARVVQAAYGVIPAS
jgi:putative restriction endonuclease